MILINILYNIIIFCITISSLIIIHEYGHFFIARCFNIYVECFSLGFGKKIFQYRDKYGTNYIIRLLPFGGYVKIPESVKKYDLKYIKKFKLLLFYQLNFFKKIFIIFAGPFANILFATFIYFIIFLIGFPIKKNIINEINFTSIGNKINLESHIEITKINKTKISNWNKLNTELIKNIHQKKEINIEFHKINSSSFQKKKLNFDKNFLSFLNEKNLITILGILPQELKIYPIINYIVPGSPAEQANLKVGDKIISIENMKFINWYNFQKIIYNSPNKIIHLNIKRKNNNINLNIFSLKRKNNEGFLGLLPKVYKNKNKLYFRYKINFIQALIKSLNQTFKVIKLILNNFLFYKKNYVSKLNGPISIGHIASILFRNSITYYFLFLAIISINLSIINLFPLPILDGGQLLFLIFEKIINKKIPNKIKQIIYIFSIITLIIIMGITFINDFNQF
ncbi:RIP metalloprotease RseP [Enterobacteriaceae endosymbiont of Donacia cincticornis]|uniref:RIP metalloprotease RseP n=1 Tax=Enterobacteriaceae endosymbiont of Donacia cincticornis TaxID=2675773 RepID=UPI0014491899|nr:RIP metalloprotease RseP [Enterobacteriaceae endosymbiont of Donacia cincticornis]QJC36109.1 RIP metalloprotease RseP [Enterobacteriaceae endosymbiont of Donacia cincticornis]